MKAAAESLNSCEAEHRPRAGAEEDVPAGQGGRPGVFMHLYDYSKAFLINHGLANFLSPLGEGRA